MSDTLLEIKDLKVHFPIRSKNLFGGVTKYVKAVDGVSFYIEKGETLGLVGESGSGKTTVGRSILRAIEPTAGKVTFNVDDETFDLSQLTDKEMRGFREHMQLIFQDPYSSLNPRMTVRDIIAEPLIAQKLATGDEVDERVREAAALCKLNLEFLRRFPHAFSGGQRQRIGIARALALQPSFIVCDEPIAALDVSIQAQVVNLLEKLQKEFDLTYLFIAHDLSMVRHISDRIAVMYLGKVVELTDRDSLYKNAKHPYTKALLSAVPIPDPEVEETRERIILEGDVPNPANPPQGCNFCTRCPLAEAICFTAEPAFWEIEAGHWVACHLYE